MTASGALLEAASVSVRIGKAMLLDSINVALHGGETVAIVGPNGAGKSTLLRALSGDRSCSTGEVRLKGRALASFTPRELAQHRAVLSQHVNVGFPFTVEDIVAMGAGDRRREQAQPLIDAAIGELDLETLRQRELPTLSGGEQQRAHFARVLVQLSCGEQEHGPGVLLLDEPTSSLDLRHQIGLLEIARQRARTGVAVIAVLHDLNLAVRFADRLIVLSGGRLHADGRTAETVTTDLIKTVFKVETPVGFDDGQPFILPQRMTPLRP
ncbi:MAG: heme ABC transporter ATP-binding protein [Bradyrhizobiaceae bacterium]|nr:MAG: heme ABC transporter ATP-binding protein [Bradyrhizobiaceae bacterium]